MKKETFFTEKAPAVIGPYSQAVKLGELLFVSGQLAFDKETGQLIEGGIQEQTRKVLENAKIILDEAGSSLEKVVKTTIFLTDLDNFGKVNDVYGEYFPDNFPARSCVQVAALPKGAPVEIEFIASL